MMDLGAHGPFILMSYAALAVVLVMLAGWLYLDGVRQKKALKSLEERGVTRAGGNC